ncbi:MAG: hydrogenase [Nanohaloarchaea archaeon]|nr:hydrogenase [Candidatus Nanohaloarchaea archaeon]
MKAVQHNSFKDQKVIVIGLLAVFASVLFYSVSGLHVFGVIEKGSVSEQYLLEGSNLTGSTNIVNSIVWDLRGFDTMGEEIVFFTAALGVALATRRMVPKKKKKVKVKV